MRIASGGMETGRSTAPLFGRFTFSMLPLGYQTSSGSTTIGLLVRDKLTAYGVLVTPRCSVVHSAFPTRRVYTNSVLHNEPEVLLLPARFDPAPNGALR